MAGHSSTSRKKSTTSTSSRVPEDEGRKSQKSSRGSAYGDEDTTSIYVTAPSSRGGQARSLTESAVRALDRDDEDWEDEDKDARSERRSVRSDGKRRRRRSEKERSRSGSREKSGKRKSSSRKESEISRGKSRLLDDGDDRAMPQMGSFEQFPGQYSHGVMGPVGEQQPMMSGALPSSAPDSQFGLSRADSFGAAADYYLDEGQSVSYQPGVRAKSPNMLVNPDLDHLQMASAVANPAQDTGNGSAADFYGGKGSPVLTAEPQPITSSNSYSSKPAKPSKTGRTSSLDTAAAGTATAGLAMGAAAGSSSYYFHSNRHHLHRINNDNLRAAHNSNQIATIPIR